MFRVILWAFLALYLLLVGLCPAAAAPLGLLAAGAGIVVAKLPLLVLVGGFWLFRRAQPAPKPRTA